MISNTELLESEEERGKGARVLGIRNLCGTVLAVGTNVAKKRSVCM